MLLEDAHNNILVTGSTPEKTKGKTEELSLFVAASPHNFSKHLEDTCST